MEIQLTAQPTQDDGLKQINLNINGNTYPLNVSLPVFNRMVSDGVLIEVIDETITHTTPVYTTIIEQ